MSDSLHASCAVHPETASIRPCDRCGVLGCPDCLAWLGAKLVCASCRARTASTTVHSLRKLVREYVTFILLSLRKRVGQYVKFILLTSALVFLLARGPCGGVAIGALLGVLLGCTISATFWLLPFRWYWNLFPAYIITVSALMTPIFLARTSYSSEPGNPVLLTVVYFIPLFVFVALIETVCFLSRQND